MVNSLNLRFSILFFTHSLSAMVPTETFNFPGLPPDVQRIIQMMALKNIPVNISEETYENVARYARVNKSFHAFINKPSHMKLLIGLIAWCVLGKDEFNFARDYKNMPGVQSKEVQEWLALRKQQIPLEEQLRLNAREGGIENIEALVTRGVNINAQSNFLGMTPLMVALKELAPLAYVQKLLALGANIHLKDKSGRTALMEGVHNGNIEGVREILKHRPNVNHLSVDGTTTLMLAVERRHAKEFISALVEAGADVNLKGENGRTALIHSANNYTIFEGIEALLHYGADVNVQDDEGETALMKSIRIAPGNLYNSLPIIQALLAAKGDLHIQNKKGQTALDIVRADAQNYLQKGRKSELSVCRKIEALIGQRLQLQNNDNGIDFTLFC